MFGRLGLHEPDEQDGVEDAVAEAIDQAAPGQHRVIGGKTDQQNADRDARQPEGDHPGGSQPVDQGADENPAQDGAQAIGAEQHAGEIESQKHQEILGERDHNPEHPAENDRHQQNQRRMAPPHQGPQACLPCGFPTGGPSVPHRQKE